MLVGRWRGKDEGGEGRGEVSVDWILLEQLMTIVTFLGASAQRLKEFLWD